MTTKSKAGLLAIKVRRAKRTEDELFEQEMEAFRQWRHLSQLHGDAVLARQSLERELEIERRVEHYIESHP